MMTILSASFSPTLVSMTETRLLTPTWGAAKPTPFAAYIVSHMSAISRSSSGLSNSVTGSHFRSNTGSPYLIILRTTLKPLHLIEVALVIAFRLAERIATELFEERLCQDQRRHCFPDHSRGGHDSDITAFIGGEGRIASGQVDGFERAAQRRNGLQEPAHDYILAVGNSALQASSPIRTSEEMRLLLVVMDGVLHGRS